MTDKLKFIEAEMRERPSPWPKTREELHATIDALIDGEHDYGTCVYAMSLAAVAAYNFVAHELGATGFQASCADLDILRRNRSIDGPFALIKGEDMLYPQYDIEAKVREYLSGWQEWASKEAKKKLADPTTIGAAPSVIAHWQKLAALGEGEPSTLLADSRLLADAVLHTDAQSQAVGCPGETRTS